MDIFLVHWDDTSEDEPGFGEPLGIFSSEIKAVSHIQEAFKAKTWSNTGAYCVYAYTLDDPTSKRLLRRFAVFYRQDTLVDTSPKTYTLVAPDIIDSFTMDTTIYLAFSSELLDLRAVREHDTVILRMRQGQAITGSDITMTRDMDVVCSRPSRGWRGKGCVFVSTDRASIS